jgi:hypothetical protein
LRVCLEAPHEASSEGISYTIYSQPHSTLPARTAGDAILNSLSRAAVITLGHFLSGGHPWQQQVFEAKLLRKEFASGRPTKAYSLALSSCSERLDGALLVYEGKTRDYVVQILGADEADARVQHFLKSVRFK